MTGLPFESIPGISDFFVDYVRNQNGVREFYPHGHSIEAVADYARLLRRPSSSNLDRLCSALAQIQNELGNDAPIQPLASGAVVVITGQQAGLFSGPLYSILKALTAIKLARELCSRGIPAVPVFWIAAEDHDHEEIRWASVVSRSAGLERIEVDLPNPAMSPVGWLRFGPDVQAAVERCLQSLPESEFAADVRNLIGDTFVTGSTPVEAFGRMLAKLFRGSGLLFANPLHDGLRELAVPVLNEARIRNADIRARALVRSARLHAAGLIEQVRVEEDFTGLFAYRDRSRIALKPGELSGEISLSPNVLLRPVVQDVLFPTAAYVGGPAEIAYFAQAAGVYEAFGRAAPPVFPRISATIVEPHVRRVTSKYGMTLTDAFQGRDHLKRLAVGATSGVSPFDHAHEVIGREIDALRPVLSAADRTLAGALDTAKQKILYQVESLRTKYVNAESKRSETIQRQVDLVANSLFPDKKPQERVINVTSFIARLGPSFIRLLDDRLTLDTNEHQVIEL